jgi:hypothetical protein
VNENTPPTTQSNQDPLVINESEEEEEADKPEDIPVYPHSVDFLPQFT